MIRTVINGAAGKPGYKVAQKVNDLQYVQRFGKSEFGRGGRRKRKARRAGRRA